jgi:chromosome segregation ATPase
MSENDPKTFDENDAPLAGDALLQAMRQDLRELFGVVQRLDRKVQGLDAKVQALDAKVDARLRDTTPMWEVVVSRLDIIIAGQESHGRRLDAIEAEQHKQGARLDTIESRLDAIEIKLERFDAIDRELRHLGRRIERTIAELSGDFVKFRVDQHDLEDRVEKLEKTPA